ncbi:alpha-galactosidase [Vibrio kyushuensis]|uniref:glycoside hydrolase family 36 protein n=1 Tax=Vibrio kyushuensis TaxID=2910249 RepID=UPI003D115666
MKLVDYLTFEATCLDTSAMEVTAIPRFEEEIVFLDIEVKAKEPTRFPEVTVDVHFPFIDMHNLWTPCPHGNPKALRNKGIPEWWPSYSSHISHVAPVGCFYSQSSQSRLAFAFSDCKNIVNVHAGAYEEENVGRIRLRLFSLSNEELTSYRGTLRLDTREMPVFDAIESMALWHEEQLGGTQMQVPEAALEPVYSTWYAFHQDLSQQEIEAQCEMAVLAGCKTIILDDGWQTDDSNRGYKYCGDWQVATTRFPDFAAHVSNVQSLGMKYMLWLSVPFMGKGCESWNEFEDYLLFYSEQNETGTLDPRYPQVRRYLVETFSRVVREYNLDGLKLDFIDEFDMKNAEGNALKPDPRRDTESLPEAVDMMMMEVRRSLEAINSNIMIEFRQRYIGSMIRKYGNLFRVHDCPNDPIANRMGILDLRAFSGNTSVHSDMFTWSPEDTVESASLHFINSLFAVPQISPNMRKLSDSHLAMVKHWLGFWTRHKNILMNGKIKTCSPEMQYPIVESSLQHEKVVAVFSDTPVEVFHDGITDITIVNGTMSERVILRSSTEKSITVSTFDCLGSHLEDKSMELQAGLTELEQPISGYIKISA